MMKAIVSVLLAAALLAILVEAASADRCLKTCYTRQRYTYKCGWWGWSWCTGYRNHAYSCYQYCQHGGWSSWRAYSNGTCSRTCGGGTRSLRYIRDCNNPAPYNGGRECSGSSWSYHTESCNRQGCPVNGSWSSWGYHSAGSCSQTCGYGVRSVTYIRSCNNPSPQNGGHDCNGHSRETYIQDCQDRACTINGAWSSWGYHSAGSCSQTCGYGVRSVTYIRSCNNPSPQNGGHDCYGCSRKTNIQDCQDRACPIRNGGWSSWTSYYSECCSRSCGGGIRRVTSVRVCTSPAPYYGGRACPGISRRYRYVKCNQQSCPINGGWSKWSKYYSSPCSVTCGLGTRTVIWYRTCTNPAPRFGGLDCSGRGRYISRRRCRRSCRYSQG